mgnify:CR=1 FL=1
MVVPTIILTVGIVALVVAGLGIRMVFVKDGEFRGTCATNNPMLTNQIGECSVCGRQPGEECQGEETKAAS